MIYLDNAATTNKKPLCVKLAVLKSLTKKYCSNPGRSSHKLSLNSGMEIFKTREIVNNFFNNDDISRVIFTGSCTEALNTAIFGILNNGGNVIITENEHNSVARPIFLLQEQNKITVTVAKLNGDNVVTASQINSLIIPETKLVIVNQTSNVTGATCNIAEIGKVCKKNNIIFMVDAAQSSGHTKIDMIKENIDILAVAGHKGLMAMQGIGILIFRKHINIAPLKHGGTGTYSEELTPPISYPESLEAGTSPTPNIFSLKAGIKYVQKNFDKINNKIHSLTKYLLSNLCQIKGIKIYTRPNCYNGVVSFNVCNIPCSDVVNYLNKHKVYTRGGFHCAPLVHKHLKTLEIGGTVRISISSFNTLHQIKRVLKLLKKFTENPSNCLSQKRWAINQSKAFNVSVVYNFCAVVN